nr:transmembrane protein 266 isoform X7 [Microcebus murinus]
MSLAASFNMTNPQTAMGGGASEVEIISQRVEEETKSIAPGQLLPFAYRDLPLAAADLSTAGSQLLVNLGEDDQREGNYTPVTFSENAIFQVLCIESAGHWGKGQASRSNWLKPCCGKRAAMWQVFLLSASLNSFLVACVILVVILLTLELLIDIKLLQFSSAFQFAGVIHWISLVILSVFFSETVLRIVVLGIWDYIENKIEVFDGAVIILSLAPMVASTVANGPRSPWDAISLIIMLRIWRVKRVIDAYVLPVKVEMEMVIQQYEKAKVIQDEQLERLTQICQEQGVEGPSESSCSCQDLADGGPRPRAADRCVQPCTAVGAEDEDRSLRALSVPPSWTTLASGYYREMGFPAFLTAAISSDHGAHLILKRTLPRREPRGSWEEGRHWRSVAPFPSPGWPATAAPTRPARWTLAASDPQVQHPSSGKSFPFAFLFFCLDPGQNFLKS